MIPAGRAEVDPALNAVQRAVITAQHDGHWMIESFQNTPAHYHGRPELAQALTDELRALQPHPPSNL
jgi:hypothetical protein